MKLIDSQLLNQLKDIAIGVSNRKCKNTMGQMFCVESAFVKRPCYSGLIKNLNRKILNFLHLWKWSMSKKIQLIGKKINTLFVKCH